MPHDKDGALVDKGDIVRINFQVLSIDSNSDDSCNVTLIAVDAPYGVYVPTMVCNSRIAEKV